MDGRTKMMTTKWFLAITFLSACCFAQPPTNSDLEGTVSSALLASIDSRREQSWLIAQKIWAAAEPGYQETQSSELLADTLERAGLVVRRGVAGMPTAFVAEAGHSKPVIGILGEYDALPGLSQSANPERDPLPSGNGFGHGCGHHLFGTAAASATIALAEQIKNGQLSGTVRFYGCPAEEGGSAKVFMVREGLFSDCSAVLHWHPSNRNAAGDKSSLARIAVKFRFRGKAAHAAGAPEQGRSALDAVELTNHAAQLLREHTPDGTRIHHVVTAGGDAPNVVPAFAEVYYYIRHPSAEVLRPLYERLVLCAKAGALATETELETVFEGGIVEILPNGTLSSVVMKHLSSLNDIRYTDIDLEFATRLQTQLPAPAPLDSVQRVVDVSGTIGNGSTDVGDVSWVVPTTGFNTACWVPGTPGHSWQAVACGIQPIAEQGMHLAARTLAMSASEMYRNPALLHQARHELNERTGQRSYSTLMQPGQKPPLEYRNATVP